MNFKPGDKVWIDIPPPGYTLQAGTYAGVAVRPAGRPMPPGSWIVDVEGHQPPSGCEFASHEHYMRRRDDPPPQKQIKREETGDWELCPWRPASVPEEVA